MRDWQKHIAAEGGSAKLAIQNIVCHMDLLSDEQKAAINWHPEQSVSLAVMRLIAIDDYRETARRVEAARAAHAVATSSASPRAAVAHPSSLSPVSPSSEAAQGEEHGESASPEVAHKSSSLTDLATECAALWTQIEQDCPHHGNCACAITTRHEAFDWFCNERERALNAEATVAALVSARSWQAIETAPWDTPVLVYAAPAVGSHDGGLSVGEFDGRVWWVSIYGGTLPYRPTHWMPLPDPPIDAPQARHAGARESETKKE